MFLLIPEYWQARPKQVEIIRTKNPIGPEIRRTAKLRRKIKYLEIFG